MIGVRELREHTTAVLRQIRDHSTPYVITHQGQPIALLTPIQPEAVEAALAQVALGSAPARWETYLRLADDLRRVWPANRHTQDVLDGVRR